MTMYHVQTSDAMDPVQVDLTSSEVNGVIKVLKALAAQGELVNISDMYDTIYDNYDEWAANRKANSSSKIKGRYIKSSGTYPDFKKIAEAQRFLDSQDSDKVELVDDCYYEILDMYADYDADTFINNESSIMRDYKSEAAETWTELSVDEADALFDKIYEAIEITRADEAAAWC